MCSDCCSCSRTGRTGSSSVRMLHTRHGIPVVLRLPGGALATLTARSCSWMHFSHSKWSHRRMKARRDGTPDRGTYADENIWWHRGQRGAGRHVSVWSDRSRFATFSNGMATRVFVYVFRFRIGERARGDDCHGKYGYKLQNTHTNGRRLPASTINRNVPEFKVRENTFRITKNFDRRKFRLAKGEERVVLF
uniref:(northern house mosquito) hypothetical protein n=1 Tax=Culex pipiens TaxID=7175 RepID=A0A8D8B517_CULPI